MAEHTSICIVWPAWFEGSTDPELHVTALFLGRTGRVDYSPEAVRPHVSEFAHVEPGSFHLMPGLDWFGRNRDIPVLRLYNMWNPHLSYQRDVISQNLKNISGIRPDSSYGFRPHITLSNEKISTMKQFPRYVHLEPPVLWWGADRPVHSKHSQEAVA